MGALEHYGVMNSLEIAKEMKQINFPLAQQKHHSFIWIGPSPGGLHYDELPNILIQLQGEKELVIFSSEFTEAIDGDHYPSSFNLTTFFSDAPRLREIPHFRVKLTPGVGVVIPRFAYHAPSSRTADSLSLNVFFSDIHGQEHYSELPGVTETLLKHGVTSFYSGPYVYHVGGEIRKGKSIPNHDLRAFVDKYK